MRPTRDPERGAALALTLIAITALLGLGALTVLSVHTELAAGGQSRFSQAALYAAESGSAAGMEFLRSNCSTKSLFTQWMSPNNDDPQEPPDIYGNNLQPGSGSPFGSGNTDLWYSVSVRNNFEDPGLEVGQDTDGIVILRSTGYGPDQTVAEVELVIQNASCVAQFCASDYAQRGASARNDANAVCSARVTSGQMRTISP